VAPRQEKGGGEEKKVQATGVGKKKKVGVAFGEKKNHVIRSRKGSFSCGGKRIRKKKTVPGPNTNARGKKRGKGQACTSGGGRKNRYLLLKKSGDPMVSRRKRTTCPKEKAMFPPGRGTTAQLGQEWGYGGAEKNGQFEKRGPIDLQKVKKKGGRKTASRTKSKKDVQKGGEKGAQS